MEIPTSALVLLCHRLHTATVFVPMFLAKRNIVSCFVLSCLLCAATGQANDRYLIKQSSGSDCGPAALATLLTHYLDIPTSEAEIAYLSRANQYGTTLLGLEQAAQAKGGGAESFRMSFETLRQQLKSYPAPVLVRLLLPEPHFALVLRIENDMVLLADPASGNSMLPHKSFLKRWLIPQNRSDKDKKQVAKDTQEGYVLIAARADGKTNKAHLDEIIAELQSQQKNLKAQLPAPALRR